MCISWEDAKTMIEISEGDYILGFWFASNEKGDDWMAVVTKPKNSKLFQGSYRYRCRVDDVMDHTTKDRKIWTNFRSTDENETEESVMNMMHKIQMEIKKNYPQIDIMLVKGDLEMMMEKAKDHDWMNVQSMPLEEAKAKGLI